MCVDIMALSLDDCCFGPQYLDADFNRRFFDDSDNDYAYLMVRCMRLQRLSIKNATWCTEENPLEKFRVSQQMLIKMVRNHATLKWLRSDLSAENVAMLRQERPDVTFVSD